MVRKFSITLLITLTTAALLSTAISFSQPSVPENATAEDILDCVQYNYVEGTFYGEITIELFRPDFSKLYEMEVWQQGEDHALVLIHAPEDEAGSGYLIDDEDLWFYTPDAGFAIQLPSSALSENLLGADLSIDDLSRNTLTEDFDLENLGARAANEDESELEEDRVYQVRLTPKPEAPVVYGKLEILVRESDCATLRIDYYDQRDTLIRQATFSEFEVAGEEGRERVVPIRSEFDDLLEEGSRTVQIIQSYELDLEIPAQRFTLDCLEQGLCD